MVHDTYSGILPTNNVCCLHVNRGRHDVDINVYTMNGKTTCTCSWCGEIIPNERVKPDQMISMKNYKHLFAIGDIVIFNNKKYKLEAWHELEPVE